MKKLYLLIDSRGGIGCIKNDTDNLNFVDENWERFVLLSSESKKEICHHANINDYGRHCVVADNTGHVYFEWMNEDGKWICN